MASQEYGYENYIVEETSQSADTTQTQEGKGDDGPHEDIVTLIGQHVQGSYCKYVFSRLQKNEKDGQYNPRPSKGIVVKKGCKKCPWAIESFFEDPDQFIKEMGRCANLCKDQREQFILHKILPHLEESWGKCSSNNEDVYKMLTKLSCVINSGTVVKHSLQLLLHLICQDNFGSESGNLLVLEKIVRTSIFSSEGMFRKDEHSERKLKLFSYSRILSLLLIQQVRQDELQIIDMIEDLSKVHMEIKRRCDQLENKQKDVLRYSMELILRATSYLLKPRENWQLATRIRSSIAECQEFCENSDKESKDLKILRAIKERNRNGEWLDLHCLLIHLHEKVHCERPVPQMETERRAMILIRLIVEAYLQGEGGADWRFCLFASSLLVDIAKNNVTKEMRKEAGGCLVNLLKNRKLQKRPECRAILERRSSELLLCPDHEIRTFLVHFLSHNRHSEDTLPTSLHTDHLCSTYGTQKLETNKSSIHHSLHSFIKHGMFQTEKVAVKVLYAKKHHLLEEDPKFEARKRLIREADNMRRLTACQHPNFPVLLGYNTEQLPYHLITAFESHGNLLQLVRRSREREPHLKPIQLLEMLTGISRALLYLEELGLVHRSVMAENILVGDNFLCKLGGLHSLRQLTRGPVNQADLALLHGYCSAEVPEYASTFRDEDLPVRWKAPECLQEHRYSTASDVWAFGVLMYEVLTYGCTPYRHVLKDEEVPTHVLDYKEIVPLELCFENREYELIKQCCEWSLNRRLKLTDANERLTEILRSAENGSRQDPPPLEMEDVRGISNQDSEELYSTIHDVHDDNELGKMKLIEEDQEMTCGHTLVDLFVSTGKSSWKNRLSRRTNIRQFVRRKICPSRFHIRRFVRLRRFSVQAICSSSSVKTANENYRNGRKANKGKDYATMHCFSKGNNETALTKKITDYVKSVLIISEIPALYEDVTDHQDIVKKDVQNSKMIWERLSQQDEEHVRGLKALNNPHLASISTVDFINSHYWINSPECGNLKEYVLDRQCKQEHIVMFLSQVASALHYLHVNHIVHGNLRAEYVNVVAPDKVQVGRLGRSKTLTLSEYEETSTSCVVQACMPPDSTRWSAPEVILDGHYTHAADVWAFGILAWELYTSYHHGQEWRKFAEPYHGLSNHKILSYMRDIGPLSQPQGCPRWVDIIMHQCWAFDSAQRPPFLAIVDCLTSREPMQSWIMQVWLKTHEEKDWPDLSICQEGEHVTHVLDAEKHPSVQSIEKMCSEDFFAKHGYRYVDRSVDEADDEPYASCRPVQDPKRSQSHESKLPSVEDASGYLCPLEETISKRDGTELQNYNENEEHSPSNTTVNYIMSKRPLNETFDNEMSSETDQRQTTYAEIKGKNFNLGKPNRASNTDHRDCTIRDKPAVPNSRHGKGLGIGQNKEDSMGEEDCTIYEEPHIHPAFGPPQQSTNTERGQPTHFKRGQTIRRKKATGINSKKQAKLETENKENIYENSTASFQDVSEMEHVYENIRHGNQN